MQELRNKAADWLEYITAEIEKKLKESGNSFNIKRYVTNFDNEKNCGTTCCIEGWLPVIFPNDLKYRISSFDEDPLHPHYVVVIRKGPFEDTKFKPYKINIPISTALWSYVTLTGWLNNKTPLKKRYGSVSSNISFEEIKSKILRIAEDLRKGELDEFIER